MSGLKGIIESLDDERLLSKRIRRIATRHVEHNIQMHHIQVPFTKLLNWSNEIYYNELFQSVDLKLSNAGGGEYASLANDIRF